MTYTEKEKQKSGAPTPQELELINKYTLTPADENSVFTFALTLCDNEIDRDGERFSLESLRTLAELFKGKTGIYDHSCSSRDQTARIYHTQVITDSGKKTSDGEPYVYLRAKAYLPRNEKNASLIEEIETGIKKETSVGFAVRRKICSVCGAEAGSGCEHIKGRTYGGVKCCHILDEPTDAYEWSFVAVPSQRAAGVMKSFSGRTLEEVIKSYNETSVITKDDMSIIKSDFSALLSLAKSGEEYRQSLIRSCVKNGCAVMQNVSSSALEKLFRSADTQVLDEIGKALEECAGKKLCPPQLAVKTENEKTENSQFRI